MITADSIIMAQFVAVAATVVLGVIYCLLIGSSAVRVIRWLVVIPTVLFAASVIWGKIYVHSKTEISEEAIKANPSGAIESLSEALRVDPTSSVAHFKRGVAYLKRDDPQRAYADLAAATDLTKQYVEVHTDLARAARDIGNTKEAIEVLTAVIARNPRNFDALNARGLTKSLTGDNSGAVQDLQAALSVADSDETRFIAHMNIVVPLSQLESYEAALPHLKAAERLRPNDADVLGELAGTYGEMVFHGGQGSHEKALDYANRALAINPKQAAARLARVGALFYLGQRDEAIKELSELIKERPNDIRLLLERAHMYEDDHQFELSRQDLKTAQDLVAGHGAGDVRNRFFERG